MRAFLGGVALGVVVYGAIFFVPRFFAGEALARHDALRHAEAARRRLHSFDPALPRLAENKGFEALKGADVTKLAGTLDERSKALIEDVGRQVSEAQALDRKHSQFLKPSSKLRPMSADAGAFQTGIDTFPKAVADQAAMMVEARKSATEADRSLRDDPTVAYVSAMVKLTDAYDKLAQSRRQRRLLGEAQSDAAEVATRWVAVRAEMDQYAGLSPEKIQETLSADLSEIEKLESDAQAQLSELSQRVADTQRELDATRTGLQSSREALVSLEETGFQPGNDGAFGSYRARYQEIAGQAAQQQLREHLLAFGGNEGGAIEAEEFLTGAIVGGTPMVGLEEMRRQLDIVKSKVDRLAAAKATIQSRIASAKGVGETARTSQDRLSKRLTELQGDFERHRVRADELMKAAADLEDAALAAARDAEKRFAESTRQKAAWKRELSEQRSADSAGKNERLRKALADQRFDGLQGVGEAQAKAAIGIIYAERARAVESYRDTLAALTNVIKGSTFDAEPLKALIETSRGEAITALTGAKEIYEKLAPIDAKTAWAYQSALASVLVELASLDKPNEAQHLAAAREMIGKASAAERIPYYRPEFVALRTRLGVQAGGGSPPSDDSPSDSPKPAAPAEGG